jgi:hypothetical protein
MKQLIYGSLSILKALLGFLQPVEVKKSGENQVMNENLHFQALVGNLQ